MVYLWYMFKRHIPYRKPFVHRYFGGVMVYGYMIFRISKQTRRFLSHSYSLQPAEVKFLALPALG